MRVYLSENSLILLEKTCGGEKTASVYFSK
jgi:hypothetical protein